MNHRRDFLRNITLAIAASLLPKILQPIASEIEEYDIAYGKILKLKNNEPPTGMRMRIFHFKYRWVYNDFSEPTWVYEPRTIIIKPIT